MAKGRNKVTVHIRGGAELRRKLLALKDLAQHEVLENAVVAGALPILNEAIDLVPVDTGTLKRSLHIGNHSDQTAGFEGDDMGYVEKSAGRIVLPIGTNVEYGPRIEFGYSDTDSLGRRYDQPAQPYLRPAFDTKRGEAIAEMEAALKQQLDGLVR